MAFSVRRSGKSRTNRLLDRRPMPRDIRELRDDPVAYAAELRRRWGGLLSYRYIGRTWGSMDVGPSDDTVTLRRDMRGPTGAILLAVLGIAAPEGGGLSDLEAVPNPGDPLVSGARSGGRRSAHSGGVRSPEARSADGGTAGARIVDADRPRPGPRIDVRSQGISPRCAAERAWRGCRSSRSSWRTARTCRRSGRSSAPPVARTGIGGAARVVGGSRLRPTQHSTSGLSSSSWRPQRWSWRPTGRGDRPRPGDLVPCDVPGP